MAFGVKYRITQRALDTASTEVKIEILEDGYVGPVLPKRDLEPESYIDEGQQGMDPDELIVPGSASATIKDPDGVIRSDLDTKEEDKFRLQKFEGGTRTFYGTILTGAQGYTLGTATERITIQASVFGRLERLRYDQSNGFQEFGRVSIKDLFIEVLALLGGNRKIRIAVNIFPHDTTPLTGDPFVIHEVDRAAYLTGQDERMFCAQVLRNELANFTGQLFYANDVFWVVPRDQRFAGDNISYYEYDHTGTLLNGGPVNHPHLIELTDDEAKDLRLGEGQGTSLEAFKENGVLYKHRSVTSSLVQGGTFPRSNFTPETGPSAEPNEGEFTHWDNGSGKAFGLQGTVSGDMALGFNAQYLDFASQPTEAQIRAAMIDYREYVGPSIIGGSDNPITFAFDKRFFFENIGISENQGPFYAGAHFKIGDNYLQEDLQTWGATLFKHLIPVQVHWEREEIKPIDGPPSEGGAVAMGLYNIVDPTQATLGTETIRTVSQNAFDNVEITYLPGGLVETEATETISEATGKQNSFVPTTREVVTGPGPSSSSRSRYTIAGSGKDALNHKIGPYTGEGPSGTTLHQVVTKRRLQMRGSLLPLHTQAFPGRAGAFSFSKTLEIDAVRYSPTWVRRHLISRKVDLQVCKVDLDNALPVGFKVNDIDGRGSFSGGETARRFQALVDAVKNLVAENPIAQTTAIIEEGLRSTIEIAVKSASGSPETFVFEAGEHYVVQDPDSAFPYPIEIRENAELSSGPLPIVEFNFPKHVLFPAGVFRSTKELNSIVSQSVRAIALIIKSDQAAVFNNDYDAVVIGPSETVKDINITVQIPIQAGDVLTYLNAETNEEIEFKALEAKAKGYSGLLKIEHAETAGDPVTINATTGMAIKFSAKALTARIEVVANQITLAVQQITLTGTFGVIAGPIDLPNQTTVTIKAPGLTRNVNKGETCIIQHPDTGAELYKITIRTNASAGATTLGIESITLDIPDNCRVQGFVNALSSLNINLDGIIWDAISWKNVNSNAVIDPVTGNITTFSTNNGAFTFTKAGHFEFFIDQNQYVRNNGNGLEIGQQIRLKEDTSGSKQPGSPYNAVIFETLDATPIEKFWIWLQSLGGLKRGVVHAADGMQLSAGGSPIPNATIHLNVAGFSEDLVFDGSARFDDSVKFDEDIDVGFFTNKTLVVDVSADQIEAFNREFYAREDVGGSGEIGLMTVGAFRLGTETFYEGLNGPSIFMNPQTNEVFISAGQNEDVKIIDNAIVEHELTIFEQDANELKFVSADLNKIDVQVNGTPKEINFGSALPSATQDWVLHGNASSEWEKTDALIIPTSGGNIYTKRSVEIGQSGNIKDLTIWDGLDVKDDATIGSVNFVFFDTGNERLEMYNRELYTEEDLGGTGEVAMMTVGAMRLGTETGFHSNNGPSIFMNPQTNEIFVSAGQNEDVKIIDNAIIEHELTMFEQDALDFTFQYAESTGGANSTGRLVGSLNGTTKYISFDA